jgi:hypothetical protein
MAEIKVTKNEDSPRSMITNKKVRIADLGFLIGS